MNRNTVIGVVCILAGIAGGGVLFNVLGSRPPQGEAAGGTDGGAVEEHAGEWCVEHEIAEADCPFCDPSLIESKGFCHGHGVPEALCTRCFPPVIAAFKSIGDWCAEHDLPESQCTICNPEPVPEKPSSAEIEVVPDTEGFLRRRSPSVFCTKESLQIRFVTPEIAERAGIEWVPAQRRPVRETLSCTVEIRYDGNRYARLSPRAPGVIREVKKDLGDRVEPGEVLAVIESAPLSAAKAQVLQAAALAELWEKNAAREEGMFEKGASSEKDLIEARTRLAESRISLSTGIQRLRSFGLTEREVEDVIRKNDTSPLLSLTASLAGEVVERSAVTGEVVDSSTPLFAVADLSRMWGMLDLHEPDLRKVRIGQPATVTVDGLRGETFGGRVTWISSAVDPRTKTVKVRVELSNPDRFLKGNMFGRGEILVSGGEPRLTVPKESVQWEGCCNVVFVRKSAQLFVPRKVRLGIEAGGYAVVEEGIDPGEPVVTTGSFLMKTEILKGNIGAGCCEVGPPEK